MGPDRAKNKIKNVFAPGQPAVQLGIGSNGFEGYPGPKALDLAGPGPGCSDPRPAGTTCCLAPGAILGPLGSRPGCSGPGAPARLFRAYLFRNQCRGQGMVVGEAGTHGIRVGCWIGSRMEQGGSASSTTTSTSIFARFQSPTQSTSQQASQPPEPCFVYRFV